MDRITYISLEAAYKPLIPFIHEIIRDYADKKTGTYRLTVDDLNDSAREDIALRIMRQDIINGEGFKWLNSLSSDEANSLAFLFLKYLQTYNSDQKFDFLNSMEKSVFNSVKETINDLIASQIDQVQQEDEAERAHYYDEDRRGYDDDLYQGAYA